MGRRIPTQMRLPPKRIALIRILSLILLGSLASLPARAAVSFEAWLREALARFPQTQSAQSLEKGIESAQLSYGEAVRQSPFSFTSSVSRSFFQDEPLLVVDPRATGSWVLANDLTYRDRSGFSANLGFDYATNNLQQ